jgi:hypothetical protein
MNKRHKQLINKLHVERTKMNAPELSFLLKNQPHLKQYFNE